MAALAVEGETLVTVSVNEPVKYLWAEHRRLGVPAAALGAVVEEIYARDGVVTAPAVVEIARSEDHPLHPAFDWDDSSAAEKYREEQARGLLRLLVYVRVTESDPKPIRAIVHLGRPGSVIAETDGYLPLTVVLSSDELRRRLLRQAQLEARSWQRRYAELSELADVFAAIDRTFNEE